jgi:NAD(P)H-dependent flavin oxidoreductase YrpB (nitropropane dioxygenase family)
MKSVDDFRLRFGNKELVPIVIGGMGVDISTAELALEAARLGGIGHISDAMVNTVADRRFNAKFVKDKLSSTNSTLPVPTSRWSALISGNCRGDAHARRPDHGGEAW